MDGTYSKSRWLPVIFSLALLLRLAYIYQIGPFPLSNTLILDASSEDKWGQEIASGDWLGKGKGIFYTDPLYAYLLGVIYAIFGHDLTAVRVVQAVIDSGTCVLIFFLGRMVFNPKVGLLSSLLASVYGPFVYYQGFIMKTTLTLFFLTVFLLTALKAIAEPGKRRWFLSGLSLGLVAMTRGNILIFAPFVVMYILFPRLPSSIILSPHGERIKPALRAAQPFDGLRANGIEGVMGGFMMRVIYITIFVAGMTAALLPVATRNYIYGDAFVLTAPSIGMNFYIGNNSSAVGVHTPIASVRTVPEKEAEDAARMASIAAGRALTPSEVSAFWLDKGIEFAVREPGRFLKLLGRKFLLFWNHYEVPDVYNYYLFRKTAPLLALLLTFGIIAPLGITGALISFREWHRGRILSGFIIAYMVSVIVFYITSRYRLPAAVMLLPFSAYTIITVTDMIKGMAFKKAIAAGGALLVSFVVVNLNIVDGDRYLSQSHTSLGNIHYREGKAGEAAVEYKTALRLDPKNPDSLNNLAYIYAEKEINLEEALSLVHRALRSNPDSPEFLDTEAYIYLRMGRVDDARAAIIKALSIDPENPELSERLKSLPH